MMLKQKIIESQTIKLRMAMNRKRTGSLILRPRTKEQKRLKVKIIYATI